MAIIPVGNLIDQVVSLNANHWASFSPVISGVVYFLAEWLGWVMVGGLVFWLFRERCRLTIGRIVLLALVSASIAWILTSFVKSLFFVPRPFELIDNLRPIFITGDFESFPSGHATFFGGLAATVWILNRRLGWWFVGGAIIIGLARIGAGVHWLSDIAIGWLIGFACAYMIVRLTKLLPPLFKS